MKTLDPKEGGLVFHICEDIALVRKQNKNWLMSYACTKIALNQTISGGKKDRDRSLLSIRNI